MRRARRAVSAIDANSVCAPSCSWTTSWPHVTWYGTWTPWPPSSMMGNTSDFNEFPTMTMVAGSMLIREDSRVHVDVFLQHDSICSK